MFSKIILFSYFLVLLVRNVHSATIAQVVAANSNLVSQADTLDISVVAITATTPTATDQQQPTQLQSLNLAIVSAINSLTPTAPTADPPSETQVFESWGYFSNAIQELASDYIFVLPDLSPIPNLQRDLYNQLGYLNTNYGNYANLMVGVVSDASAQYIIGNNTKVTAAQIVNATNLFA